MEEEIKLKKALLKEKIEKWQLWFYRVTSDHHTNLAKIFNNVIVLIALFAIFNLVLTAFSEKHVENAIKYTGVVQDSAIDLSAPKTSYSLTKSELATKFQDPLNLSWNENNFSESAVIAFLCLAFVLIFLIIIDPSTCLNLISITLLYLAFVSIFVIIIDLYTWLEFICTALPCLIFIPIFLIIIDPYIVPKFVRCVYACLYIKPLKFCKRHKLLKSFIPLMKDITRWLRVKMKIIRKIIRKKTVIRWHVIIASYAIVFLTLIFKPTIIIPFGKFLESSPSTSYPAMQSLSVVYYILMFLMLFSLQKTARKNSVIPN